jgi:hypothetical protein
MQRERYQELWRFAATLSLLVLTAKKLICMNAVQHALSCVLI